MPTQTRDIVVIGASAGGVEALSKLVSGLPGGLGAAVFVVQHVHGKATSSLPEILTSRGPLDARHAIHGETPRPGRIYVAPPDMHLTLHDGLVMVQRGPLENGFRPSIDALFRTAAASYGPRVVAVLLTGHGDCGTAGLISVKSRAGTVIVQEPAEASAPSMPRNALAHVRADHIATLAEIPALVVAATEAPAPGWPERVSGELSRLEGKQAGERTEIVCPICDGALTVARIDDFEVFRCHVGHSFSLDRLGSEQYAATERALWAAVRSLEESAATFLRLAGRGDLATKMRFQEKAEQQAGNAESIRRLLLSESPRRENE
jgi:two-component system chemotaxis response regulator CheB